VKHLCEGSVRCREDLERRADLDGDFLTASGAAGILDLFQQAIGHQPVETQTVAAELGFQHVVGFQPESDVLKCHLGNEQIQLSARPTCFQCIHINVLFTAVEVVLQV